MTLLTYTVLTDPAPLEASAAGRPSTGTVYLVVTNTGQQAAYWSTIEVGVPVGNGAGDLTPDFNKIKPKGEYGPRSGTRSSVNIQRQGSNAFQATAPGGRASFVPGDHMVLRLENVTVASTAGLAVLKVTEKAGRTKTGRLSPSFAAVALVKTAPKELPAPHSFHPDKAMMNPGDKLTLSWQGSTGFRYEIMYPGAPQPIPVSGDSWSPPDAPNRATTYILIATDPNKQQHFLTTTVQVRNPVLETLTATTGIKTPRVQGTATNWGLTITGTGAEISNDSGVKGTLTAGEATVSGVATEYVKGLNSGDGDITFPPGGVKVWRTPGSNDSGTLYAGGVRTDYVSGPNDADGDIRFLPGGMKIWSALGSNDPGTLYARKVNGGVASGRSTPRYGWRPTGGNTYDITVDTSAAGFTNTPVYLIALGGDFYGEHDLRAGGIYNATATGFSVHLKWRDNVFPTLADAERLGWHINWVGYETS
ncbi:MULTISPECIES: hypothetical protein [Streptosporangium]|uniref:Uncharacterized protein n=1 Tax=Streptosporangium brasiliense TaxID=47480 RepID=A0ABT9RHJ0_9ACTN|nr:hypothetical protein [Streptosporangium brasiliense]MDP9868752.1 hypothetical protein [Streptosporangium brasiliense]